MLYCYFFFFFQAEDGIRDRTVTGVQTCALPISTDEHAAEETRAGRSARGQRHPHLAGAGEPVPRPDEGLPQGRQGAGARARAQAPPCPEAPEARDREAHRQTRTASKVTGASNGQGGPDRSTFHIDETLLAAKPHSGGDRDEGRLRRLERLRDVDVARLEEHGGAPNGEAQPCPDVPTEFGLGRVGGDPARCQRELDVVDTQATEQVPLHAAR